MKGQTDVSVVLPCTPDKFNEFISGLLGQPQEIDGGEFGTFVINKESIVQAYHLVTQRVQQQNGVLPVGFNVRIVYDDGTSIKLNSLKDFESFYEPKPVGSTECHISFIYLIKFPETNTPEKQEISISYVSSSQSKSRRVSLALFAESGGQMLARGFIAYVIKYTARTWGADVESLLKNYISQQIETEHSIRKFCRRNSGKLSFFVAGLIFLVFYYLQLVVMDKFVADYLSSFNQYFGDKTPIADKLDLILKLISAGGVENLNLLKDRLTIGTFFFCLVLMVYLEDKADRRKPSFVILTKKSEEDMVKKIKDYEKNWVKLWGAIVFSIVLGCVTNYVYDNYAKGLMSKFLKTEIVEKSVKS
jgi:hypothetical protein